MPWITVLHVPAPAHHEVAAVARTAAALASMVDHLRDLAKLEVFISAHEDHISAARPISASSEAAVATTVAAASTLDPIFILAILSLARPRRRCADCGGGH